VPVWDENEKMSTIIANAGKNDKGFNIKRIIFLNKMSPFLKWVKI